MRLKHIQSYLSSIPTPQFPNPKITLEQYGTSPELASSIIHYAYTHGDIGDPHSSVLDLGCGTGVLAIGCGIVGTKRIICVDCDEEAIRIAKDNVDAMELEVGDDNDYDDEGAEGGDIDDGEGEGGCVVEFILAELKHETRPIQSNNHGGRGGRANKGRNHKGKGRGKGGRSNHAAAATSSAPIPPPSDNDDDGIPLQSNIVDTVLTNPPFGTKHNTGIDISFLKTAIRLASKAVYSFHKSSTRNYLVKTVQGWGYDVEVIAQMKFDIPKMYKFHKLDEVDVDVDLIRVSLVKKDDDHKDGEGDEL